MIALNQTALESDIKPLLSQFDAVITAQWSLLISHSVVLVPGTQTILCEYKPGESLINYAKLPQFVSQIHSYNWEANELCHPVIHDADSKTVYWLCRTLTNQSMAVIAIDNTSPETTLPVMQSMVTGLAARLHLLIANASPQTHPVPDTDFTFNMDTNRAQLLASVVNQLSETLPIATIAVINYEAQATPTLTLYHKRPLTVAGYDALYALCVARATTLSDNLITADKLSVIRHNLYDGNHESVADHINNTDNEIGDYQANPLIVNHQFIGLIIVQAPPDYHYTASDTKQFKSITTHMASHLWRITRTEAQSNAYFSAMINSLNDGFLALDRSYNLTHINQVARVILGLPEGSSTDELATRLTRYKIMPLLFEALINKKIIDNQDIAYDSRIISVSISPIQSHGNHASGTVIVLRDRTQSAHIQTTNQQRLAIIKDVTNLLNSILDLDRLLALLLDLLLSVCRADMGCIQLAESDGLVTRVHEKFPDKIRKSYRFISGKSFDDYVITNQKPLIIKPYHSNTKLNQKTRVTIDSYICMPIKLQDHVLGVLHLVQKSGETVAELTQSDIDTLSTITALSAVAIQNANQIQTKLDNQKLDEEIRVASDIQKQLLPAKLPVTETVLFGSVFRPAAVIGGDYYDFFELETGHIGIIIADIIGKGVPAALYMAMFKTLVQIHSHRTNQPAELLNYLNKIMANDSLFNRFIPTFYAVLDPKTRSFTYCNAGHEPPLWIHNQKSCFLKATAPPLGLDYATHYQQRDIKLSDNDIICLFTDGLIEARNSHNEAYGYRRLRKRIAKYHQLSGQYFVNRLYNDVTSFSTGHPQHDDLTIVVLSCIAPQVTPLISDRKKLSFSVKSDRNQIAVVRDKISAFLAPLPFAKSCQHDIKLAINEAQANIIEHVYNGDTTQLIYITCLYEKKCLTITIKDTCSTCSAEFLASDQPVQLMHLEGSGLGVFLIKSLMDTVLFSQTKLGGVLTLSKFVV